MAIPPGGNKHSLYCLRFFLRQQQRNCHAFAEGRSRSAKAQSQAISDVIEAKPSVRVDMKKWKKLDSRAMGIEYGVIPSGPWTVMKILRGQGFDAYLVGGCVRDLLLKKTPKDFDVITTATLKEIKKQFHRAEIVGQRFPICMVHIRDSITEVSSFETVAKHAEPKNEIRFSQAPRGCQIKDFTLWRNSLKRDFTINSLFLDPFLNKVYDYSSGITDLKFLKLRTITPAKESFEEDCARILRGLRIAARLGLSFSKDTETALHKLSPSITKLAKARLFMEMNYMLSYGAAEPSLCLLHRFKLLEILLPLQAVYLEQQQSIEAGQNSRMLLKLFSNLDKVASCNHPSDCRLWVGVLAFHLTLVNNPQDAFVILTLASILYHGEWEEGIRFARENADVQVHFKPELSGTFASISDEELADEVSMLAGFVQDTVDILTEEDSLHESMSRYPALSCSGLVITPRRIGQDVAELFQMLTKRNPSKEKRRENYDIDYQLLGKGYLWETRFALGKIILETLGCKTLQRDTEKLEEDDMIVEVRDENGDHKQSNLLKENVLIKMDRKSGAQENASEGKQKSNRRLKSGVRLPEGDVIIEKKGEETNELSKELLTSVLENMCENTEISQSSNKVAVDKKGDAKKRKSKSKGEKLLIDQRVESPDCEAMGEDKGEYKDEDAKNKKQRKSKDKKTLAAKSLKEKTNGDAKKTKGKSKNDRQVTKTVRKSPEEITNKKKRVSEKRQVKSEDTPASKKREALQEDDKEVKGDEHELVVGKENKNQPLLSGLFR